MIKVRIPPRSGSLVLAGLAIAMFFPFTAHAFDLQGHRGARGLAPENTLPAFAAEIPERPEKLSYPPLAYEPPDPAKFRVQLQAGPVAYVVPDRELPLVNIVVHVRTGDYVQPAGKEGVAGLTGYLLARADFYDPDADLDECYRNLVINAFQATPPHGRVIVRTLRQDGFAIIEIADTGCGIPEANLKRIFDPFFTSKEVGKGTGLGLSISYKIVQEHGGRIDVHSEVGKGTRFTVWLPLKPPAEAALAA